MNQNTYFFLIRLMEILWYNSAKLRFGSTSGSCRSRYSIQWSSRLCAVLLITGFSAFMLLITSLWHHAVLRYISRYISYRDLCIEIRIVLWGTRIITPLMNRDSLYIDTAVLRQSILYNGNSSTDDATSILYFTVLMLGLKNFESQRWPGRRF